jgi:hypothetical protein
MSKFCLKICTDVWLLFYPTPKTHLSHGRTGLRTEGHEHGGHVGGQAILQLLLHVHGLAGACEGVLEYL